MTIQERKGEVPNIEIGGQRCLCRSLQFILLLQRDDLTVDIDNRVPELFGQICVFDRFYCLSHAESGAFLGQFAENHVGVLEIILVDRIAKLGLADMQPVLVDLNRMIALL